MNKKLKGILSKRTQKDESPISEYRSDEIVEGVIAASGVIGRMTLDVYGQLYANKVLVELGKQINEIWNDKR